MQNLLAQAYIGNNQAQEGLGALRRAAELTPENEKLYAFVADACADQEQYALGLQVIDLGLKNLPDSARLHFQRGYFLSLLDQGDAAFLEWDKASGLAPETEIGFLSLAEKAFLQGNLGETIRVARDARAKGRDNFLLLAILGESFIREGALPGQPEFAEAQAALEKSVEQKATYANARVTLGYSFLLQNRLSQAIEQFEMARHLNPRNAEVYSRLAVAYKRAGRTAETEAALAALSRLNAEQAARIYAAPGDTKAIPGATPGAIPGAGASRP